MAIRLARREDDFVETHEINVTPFIDVMLVLLIIFMVAAPLATVDVPVNLPSASAEPAARPEKPVFITLKADRSLAIDDEAVTRANLGAALDTVTGADRTPTRAAPRRPEPALWRGDGIDEPAARRGLCESGAGCAGDSGAGRERDDGRCVRTGARRGHGALDRGRACRRGPACRVGRLLSASSACTRGPRRGAGDRCRLHAGCRTRRPAPRPKPNRPNRPRRSSGPISRRSRTSL